MVYSAVLRVAQTVESLNPTNACGHLICKYLDWKGWVDLYTVSRCCTRGESENHTGEKVCKGSTWALKPRADVTRSQKQGISDPTKRTCVLQNLKKQKKIRKCSCVTTRGVPPTVYPVHSLLCPGAGGGGGSSVLGLAEGLLGHHCPSQGDTPVLVLAGGGGTHVVLTVIPPPPEGTCDHRPGISLPLEGTWDQRLGYHPPSPIERIWDQWPGYPPFPRGRTNKVKTLPSLVLCTRAVTIVSGVLLTLLLAGTAVRGTAVLFGQPRNLAQAHRSNSVAQYQDESICVWWYFGQNKTQNTILCHIGLFYCVKMVKQVLPTSISFPNIAWDNWNVWWK